ncbi:MAG TPA: DNA-binding domain-containing protein [Steroidobacteraceae bacterium]|nr:DNA-binding domain-containing protein [Steroidobacteraceae bacterium]
MSMPGWPAQQQRFAAALLQPDAAAPEFLETRNGAGIGARFDVYRNNVHAGLIEALLAAFPVTARLVSEESFRALARDFLRAQLPQGAALHDYGAGLPRFLRDCAPEDSPAYLPDVATLEQAWWQAYGATDAPVLGLRELAAPDVADLLTRHARPHPALRLLRSAYPVHAIWAAHQLPGEPPPPGHWRPECALITRPEAQVHVRCISAGEHAFLAALPATLEEAASAALDIDPAFDLGDTLRLAIEAGAIQELHA